MSIPAKDAYVVARLLVGHHVNGEADEVSDEFRGTVKLLQETPIQDRSDTWLKIYQSHPRGHEMALAVANAKLDGPMPEDGGDENSAISAIERRSQEHESKAWPDLRLSDEPETREFPIEAFPAPIEAYCRELADTMPAPAEFVGTVALVVAGAAIGQSVALEVKPGWTESPALYAAIVARPGRKKTPVIRRVRKPLETIDIRLREASRLARKAWEERRRAAKGEGEGPGPEPIQQRAIVKDITRESLAVVLQDNPRGVLCDPDELAAWIHSMGEYKGGGGQDRQFWLSTWSNDRVTVDRKGGREGLQVTHPFVSVIGGLQPDLLSILRSQTGADDGFSDRILLCYPPDSAFPRDRWTDDKPAIEHEATWCRVVERLHEFEMAEDGYQDTLRRPHLVRMTPEAKEAWGAWYDAIEDEIEAPDFDTRLAGPLAKLKTHAARFALILSRLRWAVMPDRPAFPLPVDRSDIEGAIALAAYFRSMLERTLYLRSNGLSRDAKDVLAWIRRHEKATFTKANISRHLPRFRADADSLDRACLELERRSAIRRKPVPRSGPGRPPSDSFEVHPQLLTAPQNCRNCGNPISATHLLNSAGFSQSGDFEGVCENCREISTCAAETQFEQLKQYRGAPGESEAGSGRKGAPRCP